MPGPPASSQLGPPSAPKLLPRRLARLAQPERERGAGCHRSFEIVRALLGQGTINSGDFSLGGLIVSAGRRVLCDLAEDPRIRSGRSPDHHGVATGLRDHRARIFRRADVAVADDGNLDCVLNGSDPFPPRIAAISLFAGTRVQRDGAQTVQPA